MERSNFLSSVTIFSQFNPSDLEPLAAKLRHRSYQRGEVVFHQGDPGDRLHFVASGVVKISIVSPDGRENDITLLTVGDCFGEMSVLDGGSRSATAVATEATETMTLSREDFLGFVKEHSEVALQIIVLMVRRLRAMDELVGDMVFLDVPTRVAKKLLELARTYPDSGDPSQSRTVPMGQEETSRLVGSSRETVSRALQTYRRMGLLTTSHRKITITNLSGLERGWLRPNTGSGPRVLSRKAGSLGTRPTRAVSPR